MYIESLYNECMNYADNIFLTLLCPGELRAEGEGPGVRVPPVHHGPQDLCGRAAARGPLASFEEPPSTSVIIMGTMDNARKS